MKLAKGKKTLTCSAQLNQNNNSCPAEKREFKIPNQGISPKSGATKAIKIAIQTENTPSIPHKCETEWILENQERLIRDDDEMTQADSSFVLLQENYATVQFR